MHTVAFICQRVRRFHTNPYWLFKSVSSVHKYRYFKSGCDVRLCGVNWQSLRLCFVGSENLFENAQLPLLDAVNYNGSWILSKYSNIVPRHTEYWLLNLIFSHFTNYFAKISFITHYPFWVIYSNVLKLTCFLLYNLQCGITRFLHANTYPISPYVWK